jgi:protein-tyrosine-phosphatase
VCATNALYSPIAEALLGRIDSQNFEALSAGASCVGLHPFTVEVMNEIGIDLRRKTPRSVQEVTSDEFDYVITLGLGENAYSKFLNFKRAEIVHWKFGDPVAESNDPEKQLRAFRIVRDQIAQRLRLFAIVHSQPHSPRSQSPRLGTTLPMAPTG